MNMTNHSGIPTEKTIKCPLNPNKNIDTKMTTTFPNASSTKQNHPERLLCAPQTARHLLPSFLSSSLLLSHSFSSSSSFPLAHSRARSLSLFPSLSLSLSLSVYHSLPSALGQSI